jgi:DNA mismatch repair protein MutL
LVERPADVGTTTRRVFVAVNGRGRSRQWYLCAPAESAYRSTISAGLRPSLFLDIRLPADAVDVNVHPAKAKFAFAIGGLWSAPSSPPSVARSELSTARR